MDDNKVIIGGSLVESLKGNYQLSLRQIFEQAFNITKSNLTPLIGGFLVLLATAFLMVQALMNVFSVEEIMGSIKIQYISNILGSVLIAPLLGGLILMGIKHSVGIKTKVGDVFNGFNVMMPLIAVALGKSVV